MTVDAEAGPVLISPDGQYRYTLSRRWDEWKQVVNFIMLNPSTADGTKLDPTLRRCRGFAEAWGYGGFAITNLFAYRATDPRAMKLAVDPVGPDNDAHILEQAQQAGIVVCAWGTHGAFRRRQWAVRAMLANHDITTHYLELSKGGLPKHPLYLSSELKPTVWTDES